MANNTIYQADSDGIVLAWNVNTTIVNGYTDGATPPTVERQRDGDGDAAGGRGSAATMPVKSGDYWKVLGATTVYWIPLK